MSGTKGDTPMFGCTPFELVPDMTLIKGHIGNYPFVVPSEIKLASGYLYSKRVAGPRNCQNWMY